MTTPYQATTNANGRTSNALDNGVSSVIDEVGSASKRSNALSSRLATVLSSSYADSDTRSALRLLDARGTFRDAEDTRLNLKIDAQQEVIDANARIVDDFGKVANQLKRIGALLTVLNQTCDHMQSHIQLAKQETMPMLEEASTLLARKDETETKQHLLRAFNQHFIVSDEDLTVLTSSAEPVNDQYFVVLSRVKQIHKDCEILLGYENQRLGLELLEQTTRNLDAGYTKLYTWIQREFKGLDLEDPHISSSIRRSLRALSERPTLFQNCLDFFGEARQITLTEAFQQALTNSTFGSAKAIEFSTHDPLRYVGDMLAWVHSATISEKEALEGLFISDAPEISRGLNAGKSSEPWARLRRRSSTANRTDGSEVSEDDESTEPTFDGHAALNSLISRNMASVSQILNQRISLTIRNLTDQITLYKTYNLLLFYQDIFVKLLGITNLNAQKPQQVPSTISEQSQNSLLKVLSSLHAQALSHFQSIIAEDVEAHATSIETRPLLQPPGILSSNLALFSTILNLRAPNLTNAEFTKLYSTLLVPVIELCGQAADTLSPDDGEGEEDNANARAAQSQEQHFEATIYRLNYMYLITSTLNTLTKDKMLAEFVAAPIRSADQENGKLRDDLTEGVADRFLTTSLVQQLLDRIGEENHTSQRGEDNDDDDDGNDSKRGHLLSQLEDASAVLDNFLASALMDVQDDLGKLSDKVAAKKVVVDAVAIFCAEFEKLVVALDRLDTDYANERARKKSKVKVGHQSNNDNSNNAANDDGVEEEVVDDSDSHDDDDDVVLLRDLYPRTVGEVQALLS